MNKINKFTYVTSVSLLLLGANTVYAAQTPEYASIHGTACQPANLGQSINFETSWSQRGTRNVNDLGSGRSFYVVCPVVTTDDTTATTGTDIYVGLRYEDRDGTNAITCTGYRTKYNEDAFVKTVSAVDAAGTGPDYSFITVNDLINDADSGFQANLESAAVVCNLVPQSGVIGIGMDHD